MYLRTPKRYSGKRRGKLINLRWLWLYLIAPLIIIPAAIVWQYRAPLSAQIADWTARNIRIEVNPPTPTATIPATDLRDRFVSFLAGGNLRNAIMTLESLTDTTPNDVQSHVMLAQMIMFRGDPDDPRRTQAALDAAYGALNADPEAPEGWVMVAMALNSAGRSQEALPYLLRARDLDDRSPMMLAVLAATYNTLDFVDRASRLAEEAIEAASAESPVNVPALAYAYVVRGTIVARTSGQQAIRDYEEAWRIALTEPSMPVGYIAQWLFSYYFNTTDVTRLVQILNTAAERDRDDPINPYLLGRVYLKNGDPNRARTNFERCRDLDPDQVKCLRWLGTLLYRDQNYTRAAELGQRAVDLGSTDPGAYLVAGLSYAFSNRCAQAVPLLQTGLSMTRDSALVTQFQEGMRVCLSSGLVPISGTPTGVPAGDGSQ
jgi:tetratricopeptide (TPR) repeat protein